MMAKDTTPILKHQEDVDLEAGDVFPHLLVLRPRPLVSVSHKRTDKKSPTDTAFRLRMVFLITIASLALATIVLISSQLISRHLGLSQRFVEDHVVLEVEMPGAPATTIGQSFLQSVEHSGMPLDVELPSDLDVAMSEIDVQMHEQFPVQQEIEIISSDGVQVVKQTEGTDFAPQDQLFNGFDNFVGDVNDVHDEESAVDYDESSEDYYEEDYDEDYEDSDYEDYPSSEEIQGSFLNAKPMDFLDGLNGEVIADNISLDDIEHIKAVLNNQDGAEHELVW